MTVARGCWNSYHQRVRTFLGRGEPDRAVALGPCPCVGAARPGLLPAAAAAPDAGAVFGALRPAGGARAGQALPHPLLAGDGRTAPVVPLPLRRRALRPRRPGGAVLPSAPGPLPAAGGIRRGRPELAGGAARPAGRLAHVRLRPPPKPVAPGGAGGGRGLHVRGQVDAAPAGRRPLRHHRPCLAAAAVAL